MLIVGFPEGEINFYFNNKTQIHDIYDLTTTWISKILFFP